MTLPDDIVFARDESPDPNRHYDGWAYLHVNGEIILKHRAYEFSLGCMQWEGGMVVKIWGPGVDLDNVLQWIEAKYTDVELHKYVTEATAPKFRSLMLGD